MVLRIRKLKQSIYPSACLLKDHEILQSVSHQLYQINYISIKHNIGTKNYNDDSEPSQERILWQQLLVHTNNLPTPTNPITTINHQDCELITENSKNLLAMRTAAAKPTIWKYYKNINNWSK
jgi:hypothetical protein